MSKKVIAELFGTFVLTLVVLLSLTGTFAVATPVLAALTVMVFVYAIGGISGCHLNPAVTIGLWYTKQIPFATVIEYVAAQLSGALLAMIVVGLGHFNMLVVSPVSIQGYVFELLGMIVFTYGLGSVVFSKEKSVLSGVIIGGSLLAGIAISALGGAAGILNPAVAIALKTTSLAYYLAQIVGAAIGFSLAAYFSSPETKKK